MSIFGYIRVSTKEQNEDRQLIALKEYNIPPRNLYIEKQSGKDFNRPAYKRMLRRLSSGDLLIIKSIDRLGRNYEDIIDQWRIITKDHKADIKVLDMPLLDTTYGKDLLGTFIADLVLQIMSYTAQIVRENIRQRQAEGIAAAKAKGVRFGRRPYELPEDFWDLAEQWAQGKISVTEITKQTHLGRSTVYCKMKEAGYRKTEKPTG